jgi:hypothetical protein
MTQVVITHKDLPQDHLLLEGIDTSKHPEHPDKPGPMFVVSDIGKIFFNRGPHWVRWREKRGHLIWEGKQVGHRVKQVRMYDLADVEKMTHALASNGAIDGTQAVRALLVVQAIANVWGYLGKDQEG